MSALSPKLRSIRGKRWSLGYYCPGCKSAHVLPIGGEGEGPRWQWDGNVSAPTLTPSILATAPFPPEDGGPHVCHHFLRDGVLEFLPDSTHEFAGQRVPLPDWPGDYSDGDRPQ